MNARIVAALAAGMLVASCGGGGEQQSPFPPGALEAAFAEASARYGVPVPVLKAVGKVETNWFHQPNLRSRDGGFGLMHLTDGRTLQEAARLTGHSEAELKSDAAANVLGAAAVLRARFDEALRADPTLNSLDPADYWSAVEAWSGLAEPELSLEYAREVFATILAGASRTLPDGERVELPATPLNLTRRPMLGEQKFLVSRDYPNANWDPAYSGNYTSGRGGNPIRYVIVHTTQGAYAGAISWFKNSAAKCSAHYVLSRTPRTPPMTQMVAHSDTAWHAGNWTYNQQSIGLEHEGNVYDPGWATEYMYCESAKLTKWTCNKHNIPCDRSHVIGHVQVPGATHTDPGSYWNWTKYMNYVNEGCGASPSTGELKGVIYADPDTNARIAGATVKLNNGATRTTGADGVYTFTGLGAGTYTITASASGYKDGSVTKSVAAGGTTWGSIGLFKAQVVGNFKGVVYEENPADPNDRTKRLAAATVSIDGGPFQAVRASDAYFLFEVPPGPHTVTAKLAGYNDNSSARTVVAGADAWGSIPLSKTVTVVPPKLHIDAPLDGAVLDIAQIDVRGSIENSGGIGEVRVLFGGREVKGPVTNGSFSVGITVPPGDTRVEAVASNSAGEGRASITVHFETGLCGFVYEQEFEGGGGEQARISGATVELLGPDLCAAPVANTTTGATGSYCLDAPAGVYQMRVKAAGHRTSIEGVEAPSDRRESVKVGLSVGDDPAPSILVGTPQLDEQGRAQVTTAAVDVSGSVEGMQATSVTVNGAPADVTAEGTFSLTGVAVPEGESTLQIIATGRCGEGATKTVTVVREGAGPTGPADAGVESGADAGPGPIAPPDGGCGCASGAEGMGLVGLVALMGLVRRTKRKEPRA